MIKFRFIQKINTMYYSAIVGLVLTTIYTAILMTLSVRAEKKLSTLVKGRR